MKAAPEAQLRLLDIAELDAVLDRLAHRKRTLPELAEVERLTARLAALRDNVVAVETEIADLEREQAKAEQDVEQVRARATRDKNRLDAGQVSSARDLENLQSEIASLERRQSDLEDVVLELMERKEEADSRLAAIRQDQTAAESELDEVTSRRDKSYEEFDAEAAEATGRRASIAESIPSDLRTLYEKLRDQHGGVGAAALRRGRCDGCHLALNTVELNRVRDAAPDEVVRCEECRRILVRTPESGL